MPLFEKMERMDFTPWMNAWDEEDANSGHCDGFMDGRRSQIREYEQQRGDLAYYIVMLTKQGFESIVLEDGLVIEVFKNFRWWLDFTRKTDETKRTENVFKELNKITKSGELSDSYFTLGHICCPRTIAVIDTPNYHPDKGFDKLYAVNRGRFIRYALWSEINKFHPIKAYFYQRLAECDLK